MWAKFKRGSEFLYLRMERIVGFEEDGFTGDGVVKTTLFGSSHEWWKVDNTAKEVAEILGVSDD
jgi:hypothetical protein